MFKVGDLAVYPAQGVGVIEAIENREVGGKKTAFLCHENHGKRNENHDSDE